MENATYGSNWLRAQPDDEGRCTCCGLPWREEGETDTAHVCPPGFHRAFTADEVREILIDIGQAESRALDALHAAQVRECRFKAGDKVLAPGGRRSRGRWVPARIEGFVTDRMSLHHALYASVRFFRSDGKPEARHEAILASQLHPEGWIEPPLPEKLALEG